jgi:hypothetical protein
MESDGLACLLRPLGGFDGGRLWRESPVEDEETAATTAATAKHGEGAGEMGWRWKESRMEDREGRRRLGLRPTRQDEDKLTFLVEQAYGGSGLAGSGRNDGVRALPTCPMGVPGACLGALLGAGTVPRRS